MQPFRLNVREIDSGGLIMRDQAGHSPSWLHRHAATGSCLPRCHFAGVLSGKGKIPYAILAVMDTLRHYPGQVKHGTFLYLQSSPTCCNGAEFLQQL